MRVHPAPQPDRDRFFRAYVIEVLDEDGASCHWPRRWLGGPDSGAMWPGIYAARVRLFEEHSTAVKIAQLPRYAHLKLAVRFICERIVTRPLEEESSAVADS